MSRHAKIVATYKPNGDELFQVTVQVDASFPDAVDEARATATKAVREMIHDALEAYPKDGAKTD